jgi:flagellar motor switch protein FliN
MATTGTFDLDMIGDAATILAESFGLGTSTRPIDDWVGEPGDRIIGAGVLCDEPFKVLLAVDAALSQQLLADHDRLSATLADAVRALLGEGAAFDLDAIALTTDRPDRFVGIFDGDELCAMFGVSRVAPDAAVSNELAGGDDTTATGDLFSPRPMHVVADFGHFNPGALELLHDVTMEVTVELGRTTMPIRDLLSLQPGMVVEIDRAAGAPIDVLVNGRRIARGEVVVVDEEFGVRITEIVAVGDRG